MRKIGLLLFLLVLCTLISCKSNVDNVKQNEKITESDKAEQILYSDDNNTIKIKQRYTEYVNKGGKVQKIFSSQQPILESDILPEKTVKKINNILEVNTESVIEICEQKKVELPDAENSKETENIVQTTEISRCDDKVISIRESVVENESRCYSVCSNFDTKTGDEITYDHLWEMRI